MALSAWLLTRLAFLAFAALATRFDAHNRLGPANGPLSILRLYAHQDAAHFARIMQFGYLSRGRNDVNVAFFPGYPLTARLVATLFGLGRETAMDRIAALTVIAWGGSAVAAVLLWRYIARQAGEGGATVSVVMLLCGPYALYFMAQYSEGPFLALALAAWLCGQRDRWWAAGLLCAGAALVRVNGLFLFAGLVVLYVSSARREGRPMLRPELTALFSPVIAVGGYVCWLRVATGHWDAWFRAQTRGWQRHMSWPWASLCHSIQNFQNSTHNLPAHFQAAMELVFAALYIVIAIALARKRNWPEFTYVACTAASLLTSTFYESVPRSLIVCFPVYLVAVNWWTNGRHRWQRLVLATASTLILAMNTWLLINGYSAG